MLLAVTSLVWLAAALWSYEDARHEAEELLDAQLAQSARLLMAQTRHELVDEGAQHLTTFSFLDEPGLHPYEQNLQFRIENDQGLTLLSSTKPPPGLEAHASGYANVFVGNRGWRVLVINDRALRLRVEVAQSLTIRDELAQQVALRLALPVLLALPLLGLLIYLVVGRALRPLNELANTVKTRTPANLTPVEHSGLPREVQPLTDALNRLLTRLDRALESERRFTADAAHELRTPLAAILMQAQVAEATVNADDRQHALAQIIAGTRRATRLVEQLLRLARIDPLAGLANTRPIELVMLATQILDELGPTAGTCQLRLHPDNDISVTIEGDADLLAVALRNLVGNALRHAPAGSEITLGVEQGNGEPRLWVTDNGPGVPEEELPHLTERFYRGRDTLTEGSGLGLAIVKRIAELHGATLALENRPGGGFQAALVWSA